MDIAHLLLPLPAKDSSNNISYSEMFHTNTGDRKPQVETPFNILSSIFELETRT